MKWSAADPVAYLQTGARSVYLPGPQSAQLSLTDSMDNDNMSAVTLHAACVVTHDMSSLRPLPPRTLMSVKNASLVLSCLADR